MSEFKRENPSFSMCGLNCQLCPMYIGKYCGGCGGGAGNRPCKIVKCSKEHGDIQYCFMCDSFPCERYGEDNFDSFITYQNRRKDMLKAKKMGIKAYQAELDEKARVLNLLLDCYNDGRKKNLFCIATNLLELEDLRAVIDDIKANTNESMEIKEKSKYAADKIKKMAEKRNVLLKLRKNP